MDDFERSETPKSGDEEVLQLNDVTPTEKVLSRVDTETPMEMPQTPAPEPLRVQKKFKEKTGLVIGATALVFTLVGGAVWFMLANNISPNNTDEDVADQPSESQGDDHKKPTDEPAPKNEVSELSVDDKLVQKLYEYFRNHINYLTFDLYSESGGLSGNIDERMMAALAFDNLSLPSIFIHKTEQDLGCYDARPVREKAYEIFGKRIELYDGMGLLAGSYPLYVYSKDDDAFCLMGGFGSMLGIHHNLYRAEKTGNSISLYVVAAIVDTRGAGQEEDFYGMVSGLGSDERYPYHPNSSENTDIMEYADKLDKFKWTFVWNGENYVFERLERI